MSHTSRHTVNKNLNIYKQLNTNNTYKIGNDCANEDTDVEINIITNKLIFFSSRDLFLVL